MPFAWPSSGRRWLWLDARCKALLTGLCSACVAARAWHDVARRSSPHALQSAAGACRNRQTARSPHAHASLLLPSRSEREDHAVERAQKIPPPKQQGQTTRCPPSPAAAPGPRPPRRRRQPHWPCAVPVCVQLLAPVRGASVCNCCPLPGAEIWAGVWSVVARGSGTARTPMGSNDVRRPAVLRNQERQDWRGGRLSDPHPGILERLFGR